MSALTGNPISRRKLIGSAAAAGATAFAAPLICVRAVPAHRCPADQRADVEQLAYDRRNFKKRARIFNEAHAGQYQVDLQFLPYDRVLAEAPAGLRLRRTYDVYFWDVQAYGHYKPTSSSTCSRWPTPPGCSTRPSTRPICSSRGGSTARTSTPAREPADYRPLLQQDPLRRRRPRRSG